MEVSSSSSSSSSVYDQCRQCVVDSGLVVDWTKHEAKTPNDKVFVREVKTWTTFEWNATEYVMIPTGSGALTNSPVSATLDAKVKYGFECRFTDLQVPPFAYGYPPNRVIGGSYLLLDV